MKRPRGYVGFLLMPLALVIALVFGTAVGVGLAEEDQPWSAGEESLPIPPEVMAEWRAERAQMRERWEEEQAQMREYLQVEKARIQQLWEQEEARSREYWHNEQKKLKQMLEKDKARATKFWEDYYRGEARKRW